MLHDLASAAAVVMLRGLNVYGMTQAGADLIEQGAPAFDGAAPILSQLCKAEVAEREVRSIAYQTKAARFPADPVPENASSENERNLARSKLTEAGGFA